MRRALVLLVAACGGGNPAVVADAAIDATPDAPVIPACREFASGGTGVPVHVTGTLAGADVQSPTTCATIDAPFGVESAGPDSVVRVDGLVPGTTYVVHLLSPADLNFYVVTGCSTASGPAAADCVLFEDADTSGDEVGRFVAPQSSVYIVVDYYASHPPSDGSYTLDVYAQTCTADLQCSGATPVCSNGTCVECDDDFDCKDPGRPRCDGPTSSCKLGTDACLADDPADPSDDGPAGATVLAANDSYSGLICSSPFYEADYFAFDVQSVGELWTLQLQWTGPADLDLELFDDTGRSLGFSFWEHPERVKVTYLTPGRYYARVSEFSKSQDPAPVAYTLSSTRGTGPGCTTTADCAAEFRNQLFRGACVAGACVPIAGGGTVGEGGACDRRADCAPGLECPSFFFVANADTRDVCARTCVGDADCAALGTSYVCTTYLTTNFCVQKCSDDLQCPTAIDTPPVTPPWYRLTCELATGRCLP